MCFGSLCPRVLHASAGFQEVDVGPVHQAAAPNYPLRQSKHHLIETIRPSMEVHWGLLEVSLVHVHPMSSFIDESQDQLDAAL